MNNSAKHPLAAVALCVTVLTLVGCTKKDEQYQRKSIAEQRADTIRRSKQKGGLSLSNLSEKMAEHERARREAKSKKPSDANTEAR